MTPNRKSIARITARALRKCEKFYADGVVAYCTPAEYLALCLHFDFKPREYDYYARQVKRGVGRRQNHYFHVKKWNRAFPVNKYALLDCYMSNPLLELTNE